MENIDYGLCKRDEDSFKIKKNMKKEDFSYVCKYVRDEFGVPIGCVVAISRDGIGVSYLSKEDRHTGITKADSLKLALENAILVEAGEQMNIHPANWVPHKTLAKEYYKKLYGNKKIYLVPPKCEKVYDEICERSRRYFKDDRPRSAPTPVPVSTEVVPTETVPTETVPTEVLQINKDIENLRKNIAIIKENMSKIFKNLETFVKVISDNS